MQALGASHHGGKCLEGHPGDVVLGLLGGEGDTCGLCVETAHERLGVGGAVAVLHPGGPDAAGGPELADLLEEVAVGIEEERKARGEVVHVEPGGDGGLDIGEAVGQSEGQLLGRGRPGLADVIPGNGDWMPAGHLRSGESDQVGNQPH